MLPTRLVLCVCALTLLAPAVFAQQAPPDPPVEICIYIPEGMPIQIKVTRDENAGRQQYNIQRICGPEVDKVRMIALTIGPDNKVREGRGEIAENEARITTARAWETATIAYTSSVDVRRLILIVQRVETDTGVWVLDNGDQRLNLRAIVERGADALPGAKFIKRE